MANQRFRLNPEEQRIIKLHRQGNRQQSEGEDDISTTETTTTTKTNDYKKKLFVLSAWNKKGYMMDIDEYCRHYQLPRADISSYKLVSHTGTPFYNIAFKEQLDDETDIESIREIISRELKRTYSYQPSEAKTPMEGVLKWSDLHFGAHIRNLVLTHDYDSNILYNGLMRSVADLNFMGFKKAHVHINGDLIESFTGLSHVNSWMSMDKDQTGANSIMLCAELLEKVLKEVKNLGCVKIVAGNHDRLSKANDEEVRGGAAELIAYCLRLKGFDVEFHPFVITHLVDGINHINLHGHCGISKQPTTDITWKYGIKGVYNFVFEGHLHSLIEKLSVSAQQKFKLIKDDGIDFRRMHLQSFFTGNYYSETLGYSSNAGYLIVWDNGYGKPKTLNDTI